MCQLSKIPRIGNRSSLLFVLVVEQRHALGFKTFLIIHDECFLFFLILFFCFVLFCFEKRKTKEQTQTPLKKFQKIRKRRRRRRRCVSFFFSFVPSLFSLSFLLPSSDSINRGKATQDDAWTRFNGPNIIRILYYINYTYRILDRYVDLEMWSISFLCFV